MTAARANRRRLGVFLGTLAVALAVSLAYTFLRPAEYRATSRLEIIPGLGSAPSQAQSGPISTAITDNAAESPRPFLTEVQVLTSRPVLAQAAGRLAHAGQDPSALGSDPIDFIQSHLEARPIADTNVVELAVTGSNAELAAALANAIVEAYRVRMEEDYRQSATEVVDRADEQAKRLEASVAAKRREVEAFRLRHNIVSLERGENEALARASNANASLKTVEERMAIAEGKYRALAESAAAGKSVVRARDDPTLAGLEQRASQARVELGELERGFTPDYLGREPRAIALRARIAELDVQAKAQRETSQRAALQEAQDELASAQQAVQRIQSQIAGSRQEASAFTARYNEYKSRQNELDALDAAYRAAAERKVKLAASEQARMPTINVLETASTPRQPWRPLYWRDAAVGVAGSVVLALLAMGLVELFNRPEPQPALVIAQSLAGRPYEAMPILAGGGAAGAALPGMAMPLLAQQPTLPRELRQDELSALLRAASGVDRAAVLMLLSGVSPDELAGLRWSDVDLAQHRVRIGGEPAREIGLSEPVHRVLAARPSPAGTEPLFGAPGRAGARDAFDAQILCAAHDAGLESAAEVTTECLRHTYIAFLVRQGIRFADLTELVGYLPRDVLARYAALAPGGSRTPREAIDTVLPAVRQIGSG
jgi:uncharacterized protein involved in exopolysaccharide biosynthesis